MSGSPQGILYGNPQAVSCPVYTVCVGTAASMGAVLFLAGDHREIFPHAKVMIHDPLIPEGVGGSALRVENISRELMKTREVIRSIIGKHIEKSMDEAWLFTRGQKARLVKKYVPA